MLKLKVCHLLPFLLVTIGCSYVVGQILQSGKFHCLRSGFECLNNGTCKEGICYCMTNNTGLQCELNSSDVSACDKCNGHGSCIGDPNADPHECYCEDEWFGNSCKRPRASHNCEHDAVEMTIAPLSGDNFQGFMYIKDKDLDPECIFNPDNQNIVWYKKIKYADCGGATSNAQQDEGTIKTFKVVVQYDDTLITEMDEEYDFSCILRGSGAELKWDSQLLTHDQQARNLASKSLQKTLQPVELTLLDDSGKEVSTAQKLGTILHLQFKLKGGEVYEEFKVIDVRATNGQEANSTKLQYFQLIEGGCVTKQAAERGVILDFSMVGNDTIDIKFKLFQLRHSYQLSFQNVVKVCKKTGDCNTTDCSAYYVPGMGSHTFPGIGRRKRDLSYQETDDEKFKTYNKTVYVLNPSDMYRYHTFVVAKEEKIISEKSKMLECMNSVGFLIICITLALLLLLSLAIFAIFCVRMLHRKDRNKEEPPQYSMENKAYKEN